ncbi:MAG: carbohydrate kinase [Bacteroidales bacterium]|nr:carbohydrate kinase [Bacteroidales bacterium]
MQKVIGIGETVFDIIFDTNNRPRSAQPGGSVFNALISLARSGVHTEFISEVGNDHVGMIIRDFMHENGVDDSAVCTFPNGKSPLALAFLDADSNAQYTFYKDYPAQRLQIELPEMTSDDIFLMGSYFVINPVLRRRTKEIIAEARKHNMLIYYDINFRANHVDERKELMPSIIENFQSADIVKGSDEDFRLLFGSADWQAIYRSEIMPHCPICICTQGAAGVDIMFPNDQIHVDAKKITPVSTVGAGDSFNAGFLYGLTLHNYTHKNIEEAHYEPIIGSVRHGVEFSAEVCLSLENYIAKRI